MVAKTITLRDLAEELDVSMSTVSCAMRGMPNISEETRRRVVEVANKLGYRPSFVARQLRQNAKRKKVVAENLEIAFMLRDCLQYDPVYGRMVFGCSEQLAAAGHHNHLLAPSSQLGPELPVGIVSQRFDGVILSGHIDIDFIKLIAVNDMPMVILGNYDGIEGQYFNISLDIVGMINQLLNCCFEKGHRRIAFVSKNRQIAFERHCEEVYETWMKAKGLWDPVMAESLNDTFGVPAVQIQKLLSLSVPPTAIVTLDLDLARKIEDYIAVHHKHYINKIHFACSIMNNEHADARYDVAVVNYSEMGAAAARLLPEVIRNPEMPVQRLVVSAKLIKSAVASMASRT